MELDERRRAEKMLAQYAGDLKRSNAELEQFMEVVQSIENFWLTVVMFPPR